jgi:hypothetical protein
MTEVGSSWRSATKLKKTAGIQTSALHTGWSNRTPIYNLVLHRISEKVNESEAVAEVQAVSDRNMTAKTENPKMAQIAKELRVLIMDSLGATGG